MLVGAVELHRYDDGAHRGLAALGSLVARTDLLLAEAQPAHQPYRQHAGGHRQGHP